MASRKISEEQGRACLRRFQSNPDTFLTNPDDVALACRYGLQVLGNLAPGKAVEVRVPPYGAIQVIGGPVHTRGTPPAVVEMSPGVWLDLCTGRRTWDDAVSTHLVSQSGVRANLQELLPLPGLG